MQALFNLNAWAQSTCTLNGQDVPCEQLGNSIVNGGIFLAVFFVTFGLVFLAFTIFWILMLIHALNHDVKDKTVWVLVIIFTGILGAAIYYFIVKRNFDKVTTHHAVPVTPPSPPPQNNQ